MPKSHRPEHDYDDMDMVEIGRQSEGQTEPRTCPFCGETVEKQLPYHLPCDES
jgi:hypothetical protein